MQVSPVQTAEDRMYAMIRDLGATRDEETDLTELQVAAQNDFESYCRLMMPGYIDGWHVKMLRELLVRVERGELKRVIITMPPRHSKSMHVSELFPSWAIGRNPKRRFIAASHTQRLANRFSRRVKSHIHDPMWPFPNVRLAKDNQGIQDWGIEGTEGGGYVCVGVGGSPTGIGGDIIVIDDPIKSQEQADSEIIRETVWEWFTGTMYTRRQPGAAIIVTATRWHEDDLTGRLLQNMADGGEPWFQLHLPAEFDDGTYLWPEFFDESEYELARLASSRVWNAQYQGSPQDKDGNLINRIWFPYAPYGERYLSIVQSWDTAEKPGVTNDYSVCATIGVSPTSYDILDIWEERVAFPELLQAAKDRYLWASSVFHGVPLTVLIEDKSSGIQLLQQLSHETRMPLVPGKLPPGKDPKEQRVIALTPIMKSGRVRLLTMQPWINRTLSQFSVFPNGTNDDIVDAVMGGLLYASGAGTAGRASSRSYLRSGDKDEAALNRKPFTKRKKLQGGY